MTVTETAPARDAISVTRCCEVCGTRLIRKFPRSSFLAGWTQHYRKGARYCCNACRQKAYRARNVGANLTMAELVAAGQVIV